jgi:hypothetical protein
MNHPNHVGIDVLKERVALLKAELAGVADELQEHWEVRERDMKELARQLELTQMHAGGAAQMKENALVLAADIERKGRALISSGEKLLREAIEHREAAENIDLLKGPIKAAEVKIKERQEYWRKELSRIQDGPTRRKRARLERDLEKLEQRLARKETEAPPVKGKVPVIPQNRGTSPSTQEKENDQGR